MATNARSSIQNINYWLWMRGSGSEKTNASLNLTSDQPDTNKYYVYPKDPYEAKYQLLIKKHKGVGLKHCNDSKAYIGYFNDMDEI